MASVPTMPSPPTGCPWFPASGASCARGSPMATITASRERLAATSRDDSVSAAPTYGFGGLTVSTVASPTSLPPRLVWIPRISSCLAPSTVASAGSHDCSPASIASPINTETGRTSRCSEFGGVRRRVFRANAVRPRCTGGPRSSLRRLLFRNSAWKTRPRRACF